MKSKLIRLYHFIKAKEYQKYYGDINWLYRYSRPHVPSILLYTIVGLSGIVLSLLSSLVSKDLVDIITGHNTGAIVKTFALMIFAQLATTAFSQLSSLISTLCSTKVGNNLKADLYDKIISSEWESLSDFHSGDISARWASDTSTLATGILTLAPNIIQMIFRFVSSLYMVVRYDASFAIFALISAPITIFASRRSIRRMQKANMSTMSSFTKVSSFTIEAFANFQNIKAFNLVPTYKAKLRDIQKEQLGRSISYQKASCMNNLYLAGISSLVTYATYGWGIYKVWNNDITYGTMTMFLGLSTSLSASMQNLLGIFPTFVSLSNSIKRLRQISELPKEDYSQMDEVKAFHQKNAQVGISLYINQTSYTYKTGTRVFDNINFEAHPHEVIALVGPSGEGKTTMLRLMLAIIRAQNGENYICPGNEVPSSTNTLPITASTRQLFSYVPQGNTMFSGTIAENMRSLKEDVTDEEIIEALKTACAWDFVQKLPDGINAKIQERGGGFSEGQAQRLSIARALILKSPILLLDEATSALDIETEHNVLKNILDDSYARTTIVTTHRPSVLKECSRVYSIHNQGCELLDQDKINKMITDFIN